MLLRVRLIKTTFRNYNRFKIQMRKAIIFMALCLFVAIAFAEGTFFVAKNLIEETTEDCKNGDCLAEAESENEWMSKCYLAKWKKCRHMKYRFCYKRRQSCIRSCFKIKCPSDKKKCMKSCWRSFYPCKVVGYKYCLHKYSNK